MPEQRIIAAPVEYHPSHDAYIRKEATASAGPEYITLLSTGRCNLSCFMCHHSLVEEIPVMLQPEHLDAFFGHARRLYLAGGEPLFLGDANPAGTAIYHRAVTRYPHLRINAFSNGTLLNKDMAATVLDRFDSIHFSVDSLDPRTYANVRGKPLLETVLANIRRLAGMKREKGIPAEGHPVINVNSIIMNATLDGLPRLVRTLPELGVRKHILLGIISHANKDTLHAMQRAMGRGQADARMKEYQRRLDQERFMPADHPPEKLDGIRGAMNDVYARHGIEVEDQSGFFGPAGKKAVPSAETRVCHYPWTAATIKENGDVLCCCNNAVVMGNVTRDSFENIWNGPAAVDLRESFMHGEMKGCAQIGCPSLIDHFSLLGEDDYHAGLLQNLQRNAASMGTARSILLLRTATSYRSHLAARTLARAFPQASLTLVTNKDGVDECRAWGMDMDIKVYPGSKFDEVVFPPWWGDTAAGRRFDLVAAAYNHEGREGYEGVEHIVRQVAAETRIGILPGGGLLRL